MRQSIWDADELGAGEKTASMQSLGGLVSGIRLWRLPGDWRCSAVLVVFTFGWIIQLAGVAQGQPTSRESKRHLPAGFYSRMIELENGIQYKYAVFVPAQYDLSKSKKWPMIVFLHGSGEVGGDGIKQTTVGLPVYISQRPTRFPFIVLMPQAQAMWFRGQEAEAVWRMLAKTMADYRVDQDRVYITGLSMGGFGAWELAMIQPDAFAAIVPLCGVAQKEFLSNVMNIPVWAFHGALDKNVPVSGSRMAVAELKRLGGIPPKYTEYPDLGHECWDRAYAESGLWRWLLAQKRTTPRVIDYQLPQGVAKVWWLAIKAEPNLTTLAHAHAEIDERKNVKVETEGIANWGLMSEGDLLAPGDELQVTWNGAVIYRGKFPSTGALTFNVSSPTTNPATPPPPGHATTGPASASISTTRPAG